MISMPFAIMSNGTVHSRGGVFDAAAAADEIAVDELNSCMRKDDGALG